MNYYKDSNGTCLMRANIRLNGFSLILRMLTGLYCASFASTPASSFLPSTVVSQ